MNFVRNIFGLLAVLFLWSCQPNPGESETIAYEVTKPDIKKEQFTDSSAHNIDTIPEINLINIDAAPDWETYISNVNDVEEKAEDFPEEYKVSSINEPDSNGANGKDYKAIYKDDNGKLQLVKLVKSYSAGPDIIINDEFYFREGKLYATHHTKTTHTNPNEVKKSEYITYWENGRIKSAEERSITGIVDEEDPDNNLEFQEVDFQEVKEIALLQKKVSFLTFMTLDEMNGEGNFAATFKDFKPAEDRRGDYYLRYLDPSGNEGTVLVLGDDLDDFIIKLMNTELQPEHELKFFWRYVELENSNGVTEKVKKFKDCYSMDNLIIHTNDQGSRDQILKGIAGKYFAVEKQGENFYRPGVKSKMDLTSSSATYQLSKNSDEDQIINVSAHKIKGDTLIRVYFNKATLMTYSDDVLIKISYNGTENHKEYFIKEEHFKNLGPLQ